MNKTEKKGFYAELYNAQFLGMSIDDVEEEKKSAIDKHRKFVIN